MTGIFFASAVRLRDAKVMDIQLECFSQFTVGMVIPTIDHDTVGIILRAMNFGLTDFIDGGKQGIDIHFNLTLNGVAVLFVGLHGGFLI